MKAAALTILAALSVASPAAAQPDQPGQSDDQKLGATTSIKPGEQQAELGAGQDHDRYCQNLKQRSKALWDQADRAKDHGDFAQARDQLDTLNAQLTRDCGK